MDCLPLAHPKLGTWPAVQACALTGNRTGDVLFCGTIPSQLGHTGQGYVLLAFILCFTQQGLILWFLFGTHKSFAFY